MVNLVSSNEQARLDALHAFQVLDTAPEDSFDRITRIAKTVLQVPIVLISMSDRDRQWFKSRQGMDACEIPRDTSFCTRAIELSEPLIIPDATLDPCFKGIPAVAGAPYVRFYVGVQLTNRDGFNVGTLCCMDTKPRQASADQVAILQDLARLVVDELELRLLATTDSLTGAMTRRAFFAALKRDVSLGRRHERALICIMLDADHFKSVNDTYGHGTGDIVLRKIVAVCNAELRNSDYIGRLGGEEFAIVLREAGAAAGVEVADRLRTLIAREQFAAPQGTFRVTVSLGVAALDGTVVDGAQLLERADAALYQAKRSGRNRTVLHAEASPRLSLAS